MKHVFSLIKFSHTVFALPFALASMLVAAGGLPSLRTFLLILACMVTARTAAMAFNRFIDAEIDTKNPRTAIREIPKGIVSKRFALGLSIASSILFLFFASLINKLTLILAPVALFFLYFYSFTKRFTALCHLFIGLALGIAPIGAWIAVTGSFALPPFILGAAVIFWVAGFDIIYATLDEEFDKKEGIRSLVVSLGRKKALWASRTFHLAAFFLFSLFGYQTALGIGFWLAMILCAALLLHEHRLVKPTDLSQVNAAFFNMNGYLAIVFLAGVALSL